MMSGQVQGERRASVGSDELLSGYLVGVRVEPRPVVLYILRHGRRIATRLRVSAKLRHKYIKRIGTEIRARGRLVRGNHGFGVEGDTGV